MTLMQSKSTSKTRFFENFILSLKANKKVLMVMSALHLFGLPLLSAVLVVDSYHSETFYEVGSAFLLIGIFCLASALLCGIIITVNSFSYLYKKSQVDMIYSLPIKRNHKFLSDFFSGLAGYTVPYIVACVMSQIIIVLGQLVLRGNDDFSMIQEAGVLILQLELIGLFAMTMLYTLIVLVLCCCGSFFESCMNIVMINLFIPGTIAVVALMFFSELYGVPVFDTILPILGYTSPIGAAIYFLNDVDNLLVDETDVIYINVVLYAKWIVAFLAFTVVYFFIAMTLYKKRKAEDVSKPYVFKLLYYVLITVITMTICLIARFEGDVIIPVLIFAFIIYMIFEVITNRGFKKFYKSIARYTVTVIGIFIIACVSDSTHGFGVQDKVYSSSKIKSVELSYSGIDSVLNEVDTSYGFYGFSDLNGAKYTDRGIIETVTNVQRQALETYRSGNYLFQGSGLDSGYYDTYEVNADTNTPVYYMKFRFNLKSGKSVTREYYLSFEQIKQLFVLDSTENIAQMKADDLMSSLDRGDKYALSYSIHYDEMNSFSREITKDEAKELAECYKLDYMETTVDEFMNSRPLCYLGSNFVNKLPVRENFSRTIDFITKHGGLEASSIRSTYFDNAEGVLYSPKGYLSWNSNEITSTFGCITAKQGFSHKISAQETSELLKYATLNYYAEEDCYVLEVYGSYYVIPEKYSKLAEDIYDANKTIIHNYNGEMFLNDLRNSGSPDVYYEKCFINGYDERYDIYSDIYHAFDFINYNENTTTQELQEIYDCDIEYVDEMLSVYNCLIKYFNFASAEQYIEYQKSKNQTVDEDKVHNEWEIYQENFPSFSNLIIERPM